MRNVKVYKEVTLRRETHQTLLSDGELELIEDRPGPCIRVRRLRGCAVFLQFGIDCEELQGGVGHYTTAICEWPDGLLESVPVNMVKFITPRNNNAPHEDKTDD